jgi:hypothetical protein
MQASQLRRRLLETRSISLLQKSLRALGRGRDDVFSGVTATSKWSWWSLKKSRRVASGLPPTGIFLLHYDWFAVMWNCWWSQTWIHSLHWFVLHIIQRQGTEARLLFKHTILKKTKTGFGQYSTFIDYSTYTTHTRCKTLRTWEAWDRTRRGTTTTSAGRTGLVQD